MKRIFSILAVLVVISMVITSCGTPTPAPTAAPQQPAAQQPTQPPAQQPTQPPAKPAAPKFDSMGAAADEGTVKPVDKQPSKPLRIAVLGLENNPFWIPVKEGTLKAAEELKAYNTTVEWIVPGDQHTADVFGKAIDAAVAKQYDAIATIAGDEGMVPFINKAVDAGIPVATFNSETAKENKRLFFVGADLYLQGQSAGENMCKVLGNKGEVAIITGFFAVEAHELRRKGFEDALAKNCPDVKVVGKVENNDKGDIAYNQAKDFMTANPDLSGHLRHRGWAVRRSQSDRGSRQDRQGAHDFVRLRRRDDAVRAEGCHRRHDRPGSVRARPRPGGTPIQLPRRRCSAGQCAGS